MDVAVGLVETYLRLNGYLTVTEVQVQREQGGRFEAATDLDILAIRLPWAAEIVVRGTGAPDLSLLMDPALDVDRRGPDVLIGEVKEGAARLNRALQAEDVLHVRQRDRQHAGSERTGRCCRAWRSTTRFWPRCGCWTSWASIFRLRNSA